MKPNYQRKLVAVLLSAAFMSTASANPTKKEEYAAYCSQSGGVVEQMPAEITTGSGIVKGQTKMFCNFNIQGGFLAMGLETFASDVPSIAATFIKKMSDIADDSTLLKGKYENPSANFCKNIGGANIGFVAGGGFANDLGQADICVFGDGSMVSGWSLIYMATHREGYDEVKQKVKAAPMNIYIPH